MHMISTITFLVCYLVLSDGYHGVGFRARGVKGLKFFINCTVPGSDLSLLARLSGALPLAESVWKVRTNGPINYLALTTGPETGMAGTVPCQRKMSYEVRNLGLHTHPTTLIGNEPCSAGINARTCHHVARPCLSWVRTGPRLSCRIVPL